jgi:hypothetical protein
LHLRWLFLSVLIISAPVVSNAQSLRGSTGAPPQLEAGKSRRPYVILTASMSRGFYLMTDMKDTYRAMADASDFDVHSESIGPGGTWEFGASLTVRVARQWAIQLGANLMKEDICLKLEDGGWFDAWQCDASVEAGGHMFTVGVVRYLTDLPSEPQPFARIAVGYGRLELEGYADDLRYRGSAGAPVVEAAIGVDLEFLWVLDITFEAGLRFMRFGQHDVEVYSEGTTDMDDELARFLADGSTDFTGGFIRAALGVKY